MRRVSRRDFLVGAGALAALSTVPAVSFAQGRLPKYVILVDWDGFDPSYLDRVPTPNLAALAERGSLSTIRGTYHTISNPSRASMSTGRTRRPTTTPPTYTTRRRTGRRGRAASWPRRPSRRFLPQRGRP